VKLIEIIIITYLSIDIPDYDNSPMNNLFLSTNIPDCDNSPMANDSRINRTASRTKLAQ